MVSEVHGMSQRGGSVEAHLRISSDTIHSDLIAPGTADVVLAVEPMEALRQRRYLAADGAILANAKPVTNIGDYPELEAIHAEIRKSPKSVVFDAEGIAANLGTARAMNMVMLGAISVFLDMPESLLKDQIAAMFARKGEAVVKTNLDAFEAGKAAASNK